jgi:Tfp pilus assembly protein PilO
MIYIIIGILVICFIVALQYIFNLTDKLAKRRLENKSLKRNVRDGAKTAANKAKRAKDSIKKVRERLKKYTRESSVERRIEEQKKP